MKITPTPITAALAGIFSALVWPWLTSRFGGSTAISLEWMLATLASVALPAHAFVVGLPSSGADAPAAAGRVDTALLKRIAAWVAGALGTLGLVSLF